MASDLHVYKALTEAGVKPDAARRLERAIESAIASGHEAMRREMAASLMTKADGVVLKADLQKSIADLKKSIADETWKQITFVVAANVMMMLAASKLIT